VAKGIPLNLQRGQTGYFPNASYTFYRCVGK